MNSNNNFDWQQAINMNKNIFLGYFSQASGLSKAKRQPINLMEEEHRIGVEGGALGLLSAAQGAHHGKGAQPHE